METFSQYIVIDTETTGLYKGSRLVQLDGLYLIKMVINYQKMNT